MRRLGALAAAVLVFCAAPAHATGGDGGATVGPRGPEVWVSSPGTDPSGNGGGSGTVTCKLFIIGVGADPNGTIWLGTGDEPNPPVEGTPYWLACSDGFVTIITYTAANVIDPA